MKNLILTLIFLAGLTVTNAQEITGSWSGTLVIPGGHLRVVFNISSTDEGYTSTLDSPDQNAFGIPTTKTTFDEQVLTITVTNLDIVYSGTLKDEKTIEGTFKQMGQTFDMKITRQPEEQDK